MQKQMMKLTYRDTIYMRLNVLNINSSNYFSNNIINLFIEYKCILIEPFRRLVQENECIFISYENSKC